MGRWPVILTLCGLALVAVAIRVVGIRWDRPFLLHPDESTVSDPAVSLLASGHMRPRAIRGKPAYVYPPLLAEIEALACLAVFPLSPWPSLAQIPKSSVRTVGRATSVLAAVATVVLLALLARGLTGSLAAGALAGLALAFSPLHAESSRYGTPDVLAGLWVLLAAWAAVRIVERGRWRHYLWGAAAVGLAAAVKYPAGACCVLIGAAHFARPHVLCAWREHAKLAAAAAATLGAIIVVLPPGLVNWDEMRAGLVYATFVYGRGHAGFESPHPALDSLRTLFSVGLGEGAMLAGMLWLRGPTSRRRIVPLIVLVLGYLLMLGTQHTFVARNLLHFVPAMMLLSSWGLARALDVARRWGFSAMAAASLAFVLPTAVRAAVQVRALAARDTRLLARDWVEARLEPGAKVLVGNGQHAYSMAQLDGLRLTVRRADRPNLKALYSAGFRWVVYSDSSDMRYLRSADRFPERASAIRGWLEELGRRGRLVKHFPRRPLPGWDLPGSTANMYHQPDVKIFKLGKPPRR